MWSLILRTAVLLIWFHEDASCKTVMFMPMPMTSHVILHVKLARAVTDLGHQAWLVLPSHDVAKGIVFLEELQVIQYSPSLNFFDDVLNPILVQPFLEGKQVDFGFYVQRMVQMYDGILTNQTLFGEMKDVRPDLFVIDDTWSGAKMFAIFAYRMGVPFAAIDFTFEPFGRRVPFSPAVTPNFFYPYGQHMSFSQRLRNTLSFLFTTTFGNPFCDNTAVARYAPEMPYVPLNMLNSRAEIWLLQSDHILDYPKPSLPNVKLIGGMAASPAKPLPPEFQSFMDGALDGVIVVSFGSMILGLPKEVGEDILMTAFLKIRTLKVVFRSNLTTPDPTKILTAPWVPQNDLLAHPNTKVFLTHCGVSGQYQALYHAVPMVGVPFDFDQFYNAKRMEARGFGKSVSLRGLNVSQLVDAIVTVATDPHYRQTIGRASKLFREQFGVPLEKAAYWLDHVMQYGGSYMRSAGQEMPLYQFLVLDVVAVIFGAAILCLLLCCLAVFCIWRLVRAHKTKLD